MTILILNGICQFGTSECFNDFEPGTLTEIKDILFDFMIYRVDVMGC